MDYTRYIKFGTSHLPHLPRKHSTSKFEHRRGRWLAIPVAGDRPWSPAPCLPRTLGGPSWARGAPPPPHRRGRDGVPARRRAIGLHPWRPISLFDAGRQALLPRAGRGRLGEVASVGLGGRPAERHGECSGIKARDGERPPLSKRAVIQQVIKQGAKV